MALLCSYIHLLSIIQLSDVCIVCRKKYWPCPTIFRVVQCGLNATVCLHIFMHLRRDESSRVLICEGLTFAVSALWAKVCTVSHFILLEKQTKLNVIKCQWPENLFMIWLQRYFTVILTVELRETCWSFKTVYAWGQECGIYKNWILNAETPISV